MTQPFINPTERISATEEKRKNKYIEYWIALEASIATICVSEADIVVRNDSIMVNILSYFIAIMETYISLRGWAGQGRL